MSYILDALRKADAQRERDPARGIHAQPVRAPIAGGREPAAGRTGFWAATAAGLAVLALAGWYLYSGSNDVPAVPPPRPEAAIAPAPSVTAPPPPATAVLPPPVVVEPPVVAAPPVPVPAPVVKAPAVATAPRRAAAPAPAPVIAASAAAVAVPTAPAAAPAPAAAEAAAGLPPDAPKLAISGGVYSANAAQRMLIVNGQVFSEGAEVGPGMVLEEIRPKAAVLKFRGSRYSIPY